MDLRDRKRTDSTFQSDDGFQRIVTVVKLVTFLVLAGVGLKLTFWAVDVIDQLLHHPEEVAILKPLLGPASGEERFLQVEETDRGFAIRDKNGLSMVVLIALLFVLFGVIGRAIAALVGGGVRLLTSIAADRRPAERDRGG
jgi:hypothetical protein